MELLVKEATPLPLVALANLELAALKVRQEQGLCGELLIITSCLAMAWGGLRWSDF